MKQRVSKKAIELRIEWLNKALGRPTEAWTRTPAGPKSNPGHFCVDHQLGGYRVECDGSPIFGSQRMSRNELCNQLEAILVAIKIARNEQHGGAWPMEQKTAA